MARKKKQEGYCYIMMTEYELTSLYGPGDGQKSLEAALKEFEKDCNDIAKYHGYKKEQIFVPGVEEYKNYIRSLWEVGNGPDNEEGTGTDN